MTEQDPETTPDEAEAELESVPEPSAPKSLDELMKLLPEDQQNLIKGELNTKRTEARKLREQVAQLQPKVAEHDRAVEAQKTAEERAAEVSNTLRADNEGLRKRLVTQEIRVLAGVKFADPDDPVGFLNADDYINTDLEPDSQAISDALDDLLARKPHLAKADPKPRPPAPNPAQGAGLPVKRGGEGGLAEAERRFGKQKTSA